MKFSAASKYRRARELLVTTGGHVIVLSAGKFDGASRDELQELFKAAAAQSAKQIVVHFHGGLIDKESGLEAASKLKPIYEAAGAFPIFFVWESGWKEIVEQQIPVIFREKIFQRILVTVSRYCKAKVDGAADPEQARSEGALTDTPESKILEEIQKRTPFAGTEPDLTEDSLVTPEESARIEQMLSENTGFTIDAEVVANDPDSTLMSDELVPRTEPGNGEVDRGGVTTVLLIGRCAIVIGRVIKRFVKKRHHGFYLTIVEEILRGFYLGSVGKFFWNEMKKNIDNAFGFAPDCGGTAFVAGMSQVLTANPELKVTLVGHSAGSIYACRLLRGLPAQLPDSVRLNLILVAAAIDVKSFAETLRAVGDRIEGFRSFGMSDERERVDAIFGRLFPSSLLYFVSGVLEDESDMPLVGMERFYAPEYKQEGLEYISAIGEFETCRHPHSFVWAPADHGDGKACDMHSHGGWVEATATLKSVQYLISNGFEHP
jgi:hypothetical protein